MLSRTALYINHQLLSKKCVVSQKFIGRSMHITRHIGNNTIKFSPNHKIVRYSPVLCSSFIRSISSDGSIDVNNISETSTTSTTVIDNIAQNIPANAATTDILNNIPDVPSPPVLEVLQTVATHSEPTFASLGLGGWWPIGIVQQFLELLHVSCGIPWWGTITIGTICVRTLLFPLVIIQQRSAAHLYNVMPGMQKLQMKVSEARINGDQFAASRYSMELIQYMKENKCNPMSSMIVPIFQAPIFVSFFIGLRRMSNLPVESMTHGGILWFENLTLTDPYYILPVLTSATLAMIIKIGGEGSHPAQLGMVRYIFQAVPFIIFPFIMNFPAAIVWYWVSTNIISMGQVWFLRLPKVREYFKIPKRIEHPKSVMQPKNFKEGFKESWTNMKLTREMVDRQQMDMVQFNKAGRGPIQKTYSYNPLRDNIGKSQVISKKQ